MVGLPHQLQRRWRGGGNGDGDGVGDGVGDGGGGGDGVQWEQPGCGVAWPPPHCRLAGERVGDAGLLTPTTHMRGLIRSVWWRYIPPLGGYGKVNKKKNIYIN